jgi:hypothetical protein
MARPSPVARRADYLHPTNKSQLWVSRQGCRCRQLFVLQIVQPGLAGLMDGSVSTLAPVFAAALATKNSWDAFLVGMAASLGKKRPQTIGRTIREAQDDVLVGWSDLSSQRIAFTTPPSTRNAAPLVAEESSPAR